MVVMVGRSAWEIFGKISHRRTGLQNTNIARSVLIKVLMLSEIRRQDQEEESKKFNLPQLTVTRMTTRGVGCDSLGSTSCGETGFTINVVALIIDSQQAFWYVHVTALRKLAGERSPCYHDELLPTRRSTVVKKCNNLKSKHNLKLTSVQFQEHHSPSPRQLFH
jgi:hypothetical protein